MNESECEEKMSKSKPSSKYSLSLIKNLKLSSLLRALNLFNSKENESDIGKKGKYYEKEAYYPPRKFRQQQHAAQAMTPNDEEEADDDTYKYHMNAEVANEAGGEKLAPNLSALSNEMRHRKYHHNSYYNYDEHDFYDDETGEPKAHNYIISNYLPSIQYFFYAKSLFTIYMIIKLIYILNCLGQFLLINKFIAGRSQSPIIYNQNNSYVRTDLTYLTTGSIWKGFEFGYRSLANFIENGSLFGDSSHLVIFHTVVFCDFRIRMLGDHLHRHTVQCVLPINIFSEKIFTLLWFWLFILNFINFYNFAKWLMYYFSFDVRQQFIKKHVFLINTSNYVSASARRNETLVFREYNTSRASGCGKFSSPNTPSPATAATIRATFFAKQNLVQSQAQKTSSPTTATTTFPATRVLKSGMSLPDYGQVANETVASPTSASFAQQQQQQLPADDILKSPAESSATRTRQSNYESRSEFNAKLIHNMTKFYLMHDNVFILKLISCNTNELITRELVSLLLENYKKKCQLHDDKTI